MFNETLSIIYKKEKYKIRKTIKIINYQPKTFENPNIADIKSVITEHPKTSHKLSETIRQAEEVGSNSSLYSDTKKSEIFLNAKNVKIKKGERLCKYL